MKEWSLTPGLISQAKTVNDCRGEQKLKVIKLHTFRSIIWGNGLNGSIYKDSCWLKVV